MPSRATLVYNVKPEEIDTVESTLTAIMNQHRGMVGCLGSSIETDRLNNTVRLTERWGNQGQHEYQMKMLSIRADYKAVLAALEGEPELTYEEI